MRRRLHQAAHSSAPTCHDPAILRARLARRTLAGTATAALLLAAPLLGCGDGGLALGREDPRLTERDAAGDVADGRAWERAMERPGEIDEETIRQAFTDARPELDLRAAGVSVTDRTLRLRLTTEAPIRRGVFGLWAYRTGCGDAALGVDIRLDENGEPTVLATEDENRRVRPVDDAVVEIDGNELELALPLLADTEIGDWHLLSGDRPAFSEEDAAGGGYGDMLPDAYITGASFTRGTGTPNYVEPPPCGPSDPPLLPR